MADHTDRTQTPGRRSPHPITTTWTTNPTTSTCSSADPALHLVPLHRPACWRAPGRGAPPNPKGIP
ncbi:hypothetical protein AB0C81_26730 [Streptomyces roseoverticillatus]|uniref:hypothetical protein n=1 Tax=Streptomyces roseoverticillatus TaxID=66429 RepID=UPI0033C5358D